jgi:hypothetical protein
MALLDPILMFEAASATAWPHETKFVKVLNIIGGDPSYNELTHTLTVTLGGGEGGAELVTYTNEGTVNQFVESELRLFGSDGTTAGGEWSVKSKAFLDSALADNSIDLGKLHGGSASNNQVLRFSTSTGKWAPSNERVASVTGSGIATVTNPSGDVYNVHVPAPSYPSVPTYYAGAGMTADGTTFNVMAENGSIVVNADSLRVGFDATTPLANGVAAHGDSPYPAAANHVHPAAADSNTIVRYDPVIAIVYNMTVSSPGKPVQRLSVDSRVWNQSESPDDGIYVWKGEAVPAVRADDMPASAVLDLTKTHLIPVSKSQESGDESSFVFSTSTSGTVTVGTGNTSWSIVGQDPNGVQVIHHLPCYCAATRDVPDLSDFPNDGTLFDGYIVSHGMRVLLPKQTTDVTTRGIHRVVYSDSPSVHWSLARDFDLESGCVLRPNGYVVHHVNVLNGNLWGGPTRWAFWGGTVDADAPDGVFSLANLDGVDVYDGTVAASESATTLFSTSISGDERSALRVLGKITIDAASYTAWADEYYAWEVYDSSALNGAPGTDESGMPWTLRSSGATSRTFLESTDDFPSGNDSSWRIYASSDIYTRASVWISHPLPTGYVYRARVKGVIGAGSAGIGVSTTTSSYDSEVSVAVSGWETVTSTGEFTVSSARYLNLYATEASKSNTTTYGFFAHLQVDRRRIYVEPANNVVLDLQKSWQGTDWDVSTSGYANHITVSATAGTVVAEPQPYDRTVRIAVRYQRCSIPDSTTVTFEAVADDLGYNF